MSVALPGMSEIDFAEKMRTFGINHSNYREEIKKYPYVRIYNNKAKVKAWKWCHDNCGNNWIWSSPSHLEYGDIYFIHESDAIMFKLALATT